MLELDFLKPIQPVKGFSKTLKYRTGQGMKTPCSKPYFIHERVLDMLLSFRLLNCCRRLNADIEAFGQKLPCKLIDQGK